ncbi:hypothetical protein J6590_107829 [Homalodisca vitripennis]|nr:hypothetical protein J6590_107829 [Homalodisca vitripennis]
MYHVKALLQLGVGPFVLAQVRYRLESFHQVLPRSNVFQILLLATTTVNNETQAFTHTNGFRKRTGRQDHIQQLVQHEEKNFQCYKKKKQELDKKQKKDDEDFKFFESLSPHLKLITGVNKLMFRNDVQNLVMKYAYGSGYVDSSSRSTPLSSHGSVTGPCTPILIDENSYTLLNIGNMPGVESSVHMWSGNPN